MGAVGSLVLAWVKKRLSYRVLREALESTAKLASFVMFILIGSTVFALVFRAVNGDLWVEHLFTLVPGGTLGFLVVVNLIVFILGFFIDFFEIALILLPLLGPVAAKLGIDLVWFAVMIGVNLQTSFLTPPFGFALFYLRGVAPREVKTGDIYRGIVPFVGVQLIALLVVVAYPGVVTWATGKDVKDTSNVRIEIPFEEGLQEEGTAEEKEGRQDQRDEDLQRQFKSGK